MRIKPWYSLFAVASIASAISLFVMGGKTVHYILGIGGLIGCVTLISKDMKRE